MSWKKLLESAKESLNDHMWLRNEYLRAENRILRNQIDGRVQLTDSERQELAAIGAKLGKKTLAEMCRSRDLIVNTQIRADLVAQSSQAA